jgi:predicted GIY-YIG superfamily endonuclease
VLYFEEHPTKSDAMRREYYFKNSGRKWLAEELRKIK